MKPLRRLMDKIELAEMDQTNWAEAVDPNKVPMPGPITSEDMYLSIQTTKSSAQAVPLQKYEKWMTEFGSV